MINDETCGLFDVFDSISVILGVYLFVCFWSAYNFTSSDNLEMCHDSEDVGEETSKTIENGHA